MSQCATIHVYESDGEPEVTSHSIYKFHLDQLENDIKNWGVEPEHMDRLARITRDIAHDYANLKLLTHVETFENYFERWGVDSYLFHDLFCLSMRVVMGEQI